MTDDRGERLRLMIVGAQKAATTSALQWLGAQPGLTTHGFRDFNFFTNDPEYARGFAWAREFYFPDAPAGATLVAKSANLWSLPHAVARLHEHNPDAVVAALLRDPVQRAWSAFRWARSEGWEDETDFLTALHRDRSGEPSPRRYILDYLGNGRYAEKLENLHRTFGTGRVHAVFDASFSADPAAAFAPALAQLGTTPTAAAVPRVNTSGGRRSALLATAIHSPHAKAVARRLVPRAARRRVRYGLVSLNTGKRGSEVMSDAAREFLFEYYREPDARLAELLGAAALPWRA